MIVWRTSGKLGERPHTWGALFRPEFSFQPVALSSSARVGMAERRDMSALLGGRQDAHAAPFVFCFFSSVRGVAGGTSRHGKHMCFRRCDKSASPLQL